MLKELDVPGEFVVDRVSGMLYAVMPPECLDGGKVICSASISVLGDLVSIPAHGANVTLRNITFTMTQGSALSVGAANGILVDNCTFSNAREGVTVVNASDVTLNALYVAYTDYIGVRLAGGDQLSLAAPKYVLADSTIQQSACRGWATRFEQQQFF